MIFAINQLIQGRSNAVGVVTLRASQTTTTVEAPTINADAGVFLVPKTANAAAEMGNGTLYVSSVAAGTFTLTHASNSQTDKTYFYLCIGG